MSDLLPFHTLQSKDGLSHNTVWCALQDKYGFIWLGTENGLTRYEGNNSHRYYNIPDNPGSLGNNCVHALMEDGEDIWVGTNTGIFIYRRATDSFEFFNGETRYNVTINCETRKIFKASDGRIWIVTLGQGIFIYDPSDKSLHQNISQTSLALDICEHDGFIYVSCVRSHVLRFDCSGTFRGYIDARHPDDATPGVLHTSSDRIWMGAGNLLQCYDPKSGSMRETSLPYDILCICDFQGGKLLVGTSKGLLLYDPVSGAYGRMRIFPDESDTYGYTSVNAVMIDAENTLWALTSDNGACYLPANLQAIHYSDIPIDGEGNKVNCFIEDDENILIGAENGLWKYRQSSGTLKKHPLRYNMEDITNVNVMARLDGRLWIGTSGDGAYTVDMSTGGVRNYRHDETLMGTISGNDVMSILKRTNGLYEVGTRFGLCEYRPESDSFTPIVSIGSMSTVNTTCEDNDGNLWVATSNMGLYKHTTHNSVWTSYKNCFVGESPSHIGNIFCIMLDSDGRMWFGMDGNGLCTYNKEKDRIESVATNSEWMRQENIYSIQEDRSGNIWMATDKGLAVFNPDGGERAFGIVDGLKDSRFSINASTRSSDGNLFFGEAHGFYKFIPEDLTTNTYNPPVYITDIQIQGQAESQAISNGIALEGDRGIHLRHDQNNFTISVSVLSYVSPSRNSCRYIMQGLDKDWTETSSNQIEFKNLSPGDYTLVAYGINNDGYESSEPAVLHISIAPPWWASRVALIIYLLIILTFVGLGMDWWNRRLKEQYRKKQEENAIAQEQEANKSKIRFFVNLVHEIRTPLSMITLPLERLKEETRRDDKYIQIIDKNVEYLLSITNQLLEFQKMDNTRLDLNKTEFHIKKLLDDLRKQFDTAGSKEDVELILEAPQDDLVIYADKDRVRTILINLLNNAVKHAVSRIRIALTYGSEQIEVRVENDGTPIPENEKEKIFDLFYQVRGSNNAALGTGIGLSFSKQLAEAHGGRLVLNDFEGGASFSLILPIEKAPATTFFENMNKVVDQAVTPSDDTLIDDKDESCTILVVEDNPGLLKLVSDSLGRWYNVLSAACGEDALKLLESGDVTIVVSDVMMPGISGVELCQQIRSDINTSHIPVILLTAKTTVESKVEGMEAGAVVYMEKPFSMRQLHLQIENLRSLRRALGEEKDLQAVTSGEGSSAADFALGTRDMEFIEKLNNVIEERIKADGCNVDMVADMMNMSRRSFHRKVMALFGMTPNNYILKYKMQMAAKLLDEGYRASEVTDMLNFSATSYFAKCFKAEYGVNPKEYQNKSEQ